MEHLIGIFLLTYILALALFGKNIIEYHEFRRDFYRDCRVGSWFTLDDLIKQGLSRDTAIRFIRAEKASGYIETDPYEFIAGSAARYDPKFIDAYHFRVTKKVRSALALNWLSNEKPRHIRAAVFLFTNVIGFGEIYVEVHMVTIAAAVCIAILCCVGFDFTKHTQTRRRLFREYFTGNWFTLNDLLSHGFTKRLSVAALHHLKAIEFLEVEPPESVLQGAFAPPGDAPTLSYHPLRIPTYRFRATQAGIAHAGFLFPQ